MIFCLNFVDWQSDSLEDRMKFIQINKDHKEGVKYQTYINQKTMLFIFDVNLTMFFIQ